MDRQDDRAVQYTQNDHTLTNQVPQQVDYYAERLKQVVNRYQQNPEELKSLLKNKAVLAVGAALGLALLTGQIKRKR